MQKHDLPPSAGHQRNPASSGRWRAPTLASLTGVGIIALYVLSTRHRESTYGPLFIGCVSLVLALLLLPFWLAAGKGLRSVGWWRALWVGLALQGVAAGALVVNNEVLWHQCGGFCGLGQSFGADFFVRVFTFAAAFIVGTIVLVVSWVGMVVKLIRQRGKPA